MAVIRFARLSGTSYKNVYWKRKHQDQVYSEVRRMGTENFFLWMNEQLTKSYQLAEQHYREAISIEPKRPAGDFLQRVEARAAKIREEWDGIRSVEVEDYVENDTGEESRVETT